jgi:hypothetical protein
MAEAGCEIFRLSRSLSCSCVRVSLFCSIHSAILADFESGCNAEGRTKSAALHGKRTRSRSHSSYWKSSSARHRRRAATDFLHPPFMCDGPVALKFAQEKGQLRHNNSRTKAALQMKHKLAQQRSRRATTLTLAMGGVAWRGGGPHTDTLIPSRGCKSWAVILNGFREKPSSGCFPNGLFNID